MVLNISTLMLYAVELYTVARSSIGKIYVGIKMPRVPIPPVYMVDGIY